MYRGSHCQDQNLYKIHFGKCLVVKSLMQSFLIVEGEVILQTTLQFWDSLDKQQFSSYSQFKCAVIFIDILPTDCRRLAGGMVGKISQEVSWKT